jgi:hypothetical protein
LPLAPLLPLRDVGSHSTDDLDLFAAAVESLRDGLPHPSPVRGELRESLEKSSHDVKQSRDDREQSRDDREQSRDHREQSRDHREQSRDDREQS